MILNKSFIHYLSNTRKNVLHFFVFQFDIKLTVLSFWILIYILCWSNFHKHATVNYLIVFLSSIFIEHFHSTVVNSSIFLVHMFIIYRMCSLYYKGLYGYFIPRKSSWVLMDRTAERIKWWQETRHRAVRTTTERTGSPWCTSPPADPVSAPPSGTTQG